MAGKILKYPSLDDTTRSSKRAQEIADDTSKVNKDRWETTEYKKLVEIMYEEDKKNHLRELNAAIKARDY